MIPRSGQAAHLNSDGTLSTNKKKMNKVMTYKGNNKPLYNSSK